MDRKSRGQSADLFDFHELLYQFGPNPDVIPNLWKKSFDVSSKTALLYQLDLLSATPRIKKAVRITSLPQEQLQRNILRPRNVPAKPLLTATVFVDGQALGSKYLNTLIGKEVISSAEDLTCLLEQLGKDMMMTTMTGSGENIKSDYSEYDENIYAPPSVEVDDVLPKSENVEESGALYLQASFPLLHSNTSSAQGVNNGEKIEADPEEEVEVQDANDAVGEEEDVDWAAGGGDDGDPDYNPMADEPASTSGHERVVARRARSAGGTRRSPVPRQKRPRPTSGSSDTKRARTSSTTRQSLPSAAPVRPGDTVRQAHQVQHISPLWEYFERGTQRHGSSRVFEAFCKACIRNTGQRVGVRGDTYNMWTHLRRCLFYDEDQKAELEKIAQSADSRL